MDYGTRPDGPDGTPELTDLLRELQISLHRLACDRIVDGDQGRPVTVSLLDWGQRMRAVGGARAGAIAGAILAIAQGNSGEDAKLAAMQTVLLMPVDDAPAGPPGDGPSFNDDGELAILQADPEMAKLFIGEALDHLGTIETALLALEQRPGDLQLLNDIFRPFHTVKGNANALGLVTLSGVAHRVEGLLDLARSKQLIVGNKAVDVILRAVDVLTLMIHDVGAKLNGQPATPLDGAAADLMQQVDWLMSEAPQTPAADVPALPGTTESQVPQEAVQTSIKVDTRKLDNLVDMVGELIIVQSLIHEDPALVHLIDGQLARNLGQLKRITAELHRNSMALRMVPIRQAFQKVARVVRDLSRKADKAVELHLSGEDTELDRKMVEEITDPLMHMARNSIDHGIESAEMRRRQGKPPLARLTLSAAHKGGQIVIQIGDDGAGLATDRILERARARGLVSPDVSPAIDDINRLIFEPGFSTAEAVTEISGRGVGMDVVRRNIESLRGRVDIATGRGQGTIFTITIPLTMAVLDGLLVRVGRERLVLPAAAVRESLRPLASQVHTVNGEPRMISVRESVLPLLSLGDLVGIPGGVTRPVEATVVVMEEGGARFGLIVDELVNKQEVVVKSLGGMFEMVRGLAGGAILGDGRIGLIVDPHGLAELIRGDRRVA